MDPNTQQPPVQSFTQPSPPAPMPEPPKTHSWLKWILFIIIATIISSTATYFVVQSQSTKKPSEQIIQTPPTPTPTPDPTTNWKTYTNNSVDFKYPSDWNISPYTNDAVITSSSPKIKLVIVPKDGTLMNECMQKTAEEVKNNLTIKKFTRVTTGAMCSGFDSNVKQIWVVPSKDAYSPGISYEYLTSEANQAEHIFDQILSTFKFTQ